MILRSNYLLVKRFLDFLDSSRQLNPKSKERYWFHLRHLLLWADHTCLTNAAAINPAFPEFVEEQPSPRGNGNLAAETQKKIIGLARQFFEWAREDDPKKFRHISPLWAKTLRPQRSTAPAQAQEHEHVQIEYAVQLATYPIDRSNLALWAAQAAAAMLFLSGMRSGAFTTMPIMAVDLKNRSIEQNPSLGMRTKNSKSAITYLYPIPELLKVVNEWDEFVRSILPLDAPWYAPVNNHWSAMSLSDKKPGKNREQTLIRRLKRLCQIVGLPYMHPHLFRHGHAVYGLKHAHDIAGYQAVSRNLMHSNLSLTDEIYGGLESKERQRIIAGFANQPSSQSQDDLSGFLNQLSPGDVSRAIKILAERLV